MKIRIRLAVLTAIFIPALCTATSAQAQKVKTTYDKSANFSGYKRYAWAKNHLITRQRPDDQNAIGESLKSSIDRQLAAKGFVLDAEHPDFLVSYEAGGMSKADISTVPDLSYDHANPNAVNQPALIGPMMTSTDAWLKVIGGIRVTIEDVPTKKNLWIGQTSEQIKNPQKFLANLDINVNRVTAKLLKDFPPAH